jgi:glucose uptake protein GlcU
MLVTLLVVYKKGLKVFLLCSQRGYVIYGILSQYLHWEQFFILYTSVGNNI